MVEQRPNAHRARHSAATPMVAASGAPGSVGRTLIMVRHFLATPLRGAPGSVVEPKKPVEQTGVEPVAS